ncbi:MAG: DUF6065 family protein [Sphingomonadaceae bacterium]
MSFAILEDSAPSTAEALPPVISFRCAPEDLGVIAAPAPAKQAIPDWFKRLVPVQRDAIGPNNTALTVKRCMPFLDALTFGWIIPLAATVRFEVSEGGTKIDCGWDFDKVMVSPHGVDQVTGHPRLPMPPMKFHNHWAIETPPGWSCLFVPALNRPHPMFEIASGIVDTDQYRAPIHFPFFATGAEGVHVVEKGTPVAQVIPFRREASALAMTADIRAETDAEYADRERIRRSTAAGSGWYREEARAPR